MKIIRMMLMLLGLYVSNVAYGADPLQQHALSLAKAQFDKHFVKCGDTWFVYDNALTEMKKFAGATIKMGKISEADSLNGVEWQGYIWYDFSGPRRKFEKSSWNDPNPKWGDWKDQREQLESSLFAVLITRKNGEWTTMGRRFSVSKELSSWFSSCSQLPGAGGKKTGGMGSNNENTGSSAGTATGASGKVFGTQQTNAAKELSKFLNSTPVAEEEERRLLREEAARAARLNSPDLLRLKQSRRNALKRNDYRGIIDPSLQILQIDPADYESLDYLANLYTAVNEPDKALVYAAECLKRMVRPRNFALITQAYLMKKDKKNTLLWLERTLQSKYPHHPAEADLNQAFPKDQGEISRIFNKHRTTSGASTVSPGLAQNQPGAVQNAQSQPNVAEGVASVFKSIIGGVTSAFPRQDAAAAPSQTGQVVTGAAQMPASAPASAAPGKVAVTASGILESVERRQKVFPPAPDYLYETSSFTGAVSSTWLDMTSGMLGTKGLRDKYEEFYLSAVDYRNLSQVQLIRAKRYAEKGGAETASHFLRSADHYLELFNLSRQGAEQAYLGNIDAAAELARGIYEGSKKAVSFGGDALGPSGSRVVDIVFTATDFAVQASDVGVSQALKETLADILAEAVLKSVPDSSLGGKTLSEAITKKTTKVIGSSQVYGILKAASGSAKFSKAFTTLLAKSTASELNSLTKDQVAKIVRGLGEEKPQVVAQNKP